MDQDKQLRIVEKTHFIRPSRAHTKSSDFTRAAGILHATHVDVEVKTLHDDGASKQKKKDSVGFVSAQSRLDKIFQRDLDKGSTKPPPPPPRSSVTKDLKEETSSDSTSATQTSSRKAERIMSSVSSDGSVAADNAPSTQPNVLPNPPTLRYAQPTGIPRPIPAPPIQGMFIRAPTRHQKLIKTRLSDLPADVQDQEPQIRGGVAIYKVTNEIQQEQLGKIIEINAIDYVSKLKERVNELERQVSLLTGKLELQQTVVAERTNARGSLRFSSKLQNRTKEESKPGKKNKPPRANTVLGFRKYPSVKPDHPTRTFIVRSTPHVTPSQLSNDNSDPIQIQAEVSLDSSRQNEHATINTLNNVPHPQSTSSDVSSESSVARKKVTHKVYNFNGSEELNKTARNVRILSSIDEIDKTNDSSEVKAIDEKQLSEMDGDRNAAPMPAVPLRRTRKLGAVGRARSFSNLIGAGLKERRETDVRDKAARTLSMHRESNAEPPEDNERPRDTKQKFGRGMRKFLRKR